MPSDSASELGKRLGNIEQNVHELQEVVTPDDVLEQDQIASLERLKLIGTSIVNSLTYDTSHSIGGDGLGFPVTFPVSFDSGTIYIYPFVIDHPVYGDLDSNVLWIDGGWLSEEVTIPITMPLTIGIVKTELYREEY